MLSALLLILIIGSLMLLPISEESQTGVKRIKQIALTASMVNFILSVVLWGEFDLLNFGHLNIGTGDISLYFVLLTTSIVFLCYILYKYYTPFNMEYLLFLFLLLLNLLIIYRRLYYLYSFVFNNGNEICGDFYYKNFWVLSNNERDNNIRLVGILRAGLIGLRSIPKKTGFKVARTVGATGVGIRATKVVSSYSMASLKRFVQGQSKDDRSEIIETSTTERSESSADKSFENGGTSLREYYPISSPAEGEGTWFNFLFDLIPGLKDRLLVRLPFADANLGVYTELFAKLNMTRLVTTLQAYLVLIRTLGLCFYFFVSYFDEVITKNLKYSALLRFYTLIIKVRKTVLFVDLFVLLVNSYFVVKGCSFITENYIPQDVGPLYDEFLKSQK